LHPHEEVAELLGEAAGVQHGAELFGPLGGAVSEFAFEEFPHFHQLLRAGQEAGRVVADPLEFAADQRVGVAVEGEGERFADGAPQPGGDAFPEFLGRFAAEGEDEHVRGVHAPVLDPVDDRFDDRRGLPGSWTGEHEQRAAFVVDDPALVVVELGCGRTVPDAAYKTVRGVVHSI